MVEFQFNVISDNFEVGVIYGAGHGGVHGDTVFVLFTVIGLPCNEAVIIYINACAVGLDLFGDCILTAVIEEIAELLTVKLIILSAFAIYLSYKEIAAVQPPYIRVLTELIIQRIALRVKETIKISRHTAYITACALRLAIRLALGLIVNPVKAAFQQISAAAHCHYCRHSRRRDASRTFYCRLAVCSCYLALCYIIRCCDISVIHIITCYAFLYASLDRVTCPHVIKRGSDFFIKLFICHALTLLTLF